MIASRSRSTPASVAASALIAGMPTIAVQAPCADDSLNNASSSDTELETAMVLPRRSPSGKICSSSGRTRSEGSAGRARSVIGLAGAPPSSTRSDGRLSGAGIGSANGSGSATA